MPQRRRRSMPTACYADASAVDLRVGTCGLRRQAVPARRLPEETVPLRPLLPVRSAAPGGCRWCPTWNYSEGGPPCLNFEPASSSVTPRARCRPRGRRRQVARISAAMQRRAHPQRRRAGPDGEEVVVAVMTIAYKLIRQVSRPGDARPRELHLFRRLPRQPPLSQITRQSRSSIAKAGGLRGRFFHQLWNPAVARLRAFLAGAVFEPVFRRMAGAFEHRADKIPSSGREQGRIGLPAAK